MRTVTTECVDSRIAYRHLLYNLNNSMRGREVGEGGVLLLFELP